MSSNFKRMTMFNAPPSMILTTLLEEPLQADGFAKDNGEGQERVNGAMQQAGMNLQVHPRLRRIFFIFRFGN